MNSTSYHDFYPQFEEISEEIYNNSNNDFFDKECSSLYEYDESTKSEYLQSLEELKKNVSQNSKFHSTHIIQEILDENINSLQNSISIFYNMHKSQVDDINRIAEEYNFALAQLNRENERIALNKYKVQSELNSIESIHSELAKAASSIYNIHEVEMSPVERVQYLHNKYIIKYEKKCKKISIKTREIKNRLKDLQSKSFQNKSKIQFLEQKKNDLYKKINEIVIKLNHILVAKTNYIHKLNALFKTKELNNHLRILINRSQSKKESLLMDEQLLLKKLNELTQKSKILNQETNEINNVQNLLEERYEDVKSTSSIQDVIEKPFILLYNEIKDKIQVELQKEINLDSQSNFLNRNECIFSNSNSLEPYYNENQIDLMKRQLSDLDKSCLLLHEEIFNQSNSKIMILNEIKEVENKLNAQLNEVYKLRSHHNGNVDVLYDYAINRYDLEYIDKLQKQIYDKKVLLKSRKEKYFKKCDALITVIENFMKKSSFCDN